MKRKVRGTVWAVSAVLVLALLGTPAWGGNAVLMSDAELDQVFGGEPGEEDDSLVVLRTCGSCSLMIGSSQNHSSSVILVNAVNSVVGAQVNVIVNTGTVGHAAQVNFSSVSGP